MKKKLLPLAIAAAMAPGFAAAADTSGFVDIIYTAADDEADNTGFPDATKNANNGKFGASGEVDVSGMPADGVTVRMDVDLTAAMDTATGASATLEQAFFAWGVTEGVTVLGGVFNDPVGQEAEDAPDMNFTNHSVVYNILNGQTALYGNNVAGVAVAGGVGPATITLGVLNDLAQSDEANSIAFVINGSPMAGLDLELGVVSQASQTDSAAAATTTHGISAENVTDFNVSYAPAQVAGLTVGLDYMTPSKVIDSAYEFWAGYDFGNGFGVKVRQEAVAWEASGVDDVTRTSFNISYQAASNLSIILESASGDGITTSSGIDTLAGAGTGKTVTGVQQDNLTTLELVGTF
jgi:hypothetical protein